MNSITLIKSTIQGGKKKNQFFENQKLSKLNQEETDNMNNSVTKKEIKFLMKSFPQRSSQVPYGFIRESYLTFKEELTTILDIILIEVEEAATFYNSFYESSVTFVSKLEKDYTIKKTICILHEFRSKCPQ